MQASGMHGTSRSLFKMSKYLASVWNARSIIVYQPSVRNEKGKPSSKKNIVSRLDRSGKMPWQSSKRFGRILRSRTRLKRS